MGNGSVDGEICEEIGYAVAGCGLKWPNRYPYTRANASKLPHNGEVVRW